jgi:hypothetical protein
VSTGDTGVVPGAMPSDVSTIADILPGPVNRTGEPGIGDPVPVALTSTSPLHHIFRRRKRSDWFRSRGVLANTSVEETCPARDH